MIKCNNCGAEFDDETKFCTNCGSKIKKTKTKISKKLIAIGSSCIAIIVVAAIVLISLLTQPKKKLPIEDFVIYCKNNDLYIADITNDDNIRITYNNAYNPRLEAYMIQKWGIYWSYNGWGIPVQYSKESNRLFFADLKLADPKDSNVEIELYYDLCYLDLNNIDAGAVTIDNDVTKYCVTNYGEEVMYTKRDDDSNALYKSDLKSKEIVSENVSTNKFMASFDGKILAYTTESANEQGDILESTAFLKQADKELVVIDSYEYSTSDSTICYTTKDENNNLSEHTIEFLTAPLTLSYISKYVDNPDVVTTKTVDGKKCLYMGEKFIDDNVVKIITADDNMIIYCTDLDEKTYTGTLKIYENGKTVSVASGYTISSYSSLIAKNSKGDIFCCGNYKLNYSDPNLSTSDLYIYKNGTSKKIVADVIGIFPY